MTLLLSGCGLAGTSTGGAGARAGEASVFEGPVPRAQCGPGSLPEIDIQGRVPLEDRESGRSLQGYSCNLELQSQYQGGGANWQFAWYEDCGYYSTNFESRKGVVVVDASNPAEARFSQSLTSPAMLDPWESLKVDERRGLLAAVAAWDGGGNGPVYFDVYDVARDCARPGLKASVPMNIPIGHEGNWATDGETYYGSSLWTQTITAIDVVNPEQPVALTVLPQGTHGLSSSPDSTRLYLASPGTLTPTSSTANGLVMLDVTGIKNRIPGARATTISTLTWDDGATAQHTIPIWYGGKPHIVFVDEGGHGAARIIDISDETHPKIISKLKLEIHMPDAQAASDVDCANSGTFCYEGHYCNVDQAHDPTVLGCGYFESGLRVFDIRDPYSPREIAYYNPPALIDPGPASQHANGALPRGLGTDLTADWCSAQVRFVKERGELWSTCQDNGFMILKFTNGVWPFQGS